MYQLLLPGLETSDAAPLMRDLADSGSLIRAELRLRSTSVEWGITSTQGWEWVWHAFVTVGYKDRNGDHITGAMANHKTDPIAALSEALGKAQEVHKERAS